MQPGAGALSSEGAWLEEDSADRPALEEAMSQGSYQKDHGPIDQARELSGIYKLGFEKESFFGFALPFAIVIGVGGLLGAMIWLWL